MTQIKRVFIANRGEIARRIAQSSHKMGIESVCIVEKNRRPSFLQGLITEYCEVDTEDTALYLNQERMIQVAKDYGCDAIHPGFGFLSENAGFAKAVEGAGLNWIGPSYKAIESMASKSAARELAIKANVPCVPGMENVDANSSEAEVVAFVEKTGYPVLLKAALGGGGKGMRVVRAKDELINGMQRASSEALSSFGDGSLIVEKFLENPRHVEVQILGDQHGNVRAIGDRDCSVQRRHQKIIEEAPAPFLHADTRKKMHDAAVSLAKEVGYFSAGTVEFLVEGDDHRVEQSFFFLEMNTRLQVEHPVTEEVFHTDLVAWQFKIAMNEAISDSIPLEPRGHSIEARIYAEDPSNDFFPAPGKVHGFNPAQHPHIRWETGLDPIDEITPKFDPMIAKIVATGDSREQAICYLKEALGETVLSGPVHNMELISAIMDEEEFRHRVVGTHYINRKLDGLLEDISYNRVLGQDFAQKVLKTLAKEDTDTLHRSLTQQVFTKKQSSLNLVFNESSEYETATYPKSRTIMGTASCLSSPQGANIKFSQTYTAEGLYVFCKVDGHGYQDFIANENQVSLKGHGDENAIVAPVPGKVIKLLVSPGETVKAKQTVAILESMKMEFEVQASKDAIVDSIEIKAMDQVDADALMIKLRELDS